MDKKRYAIYSWVGGRTEKPHPAAIEEPYDDGTGYPSYVIYLTDVELVALSEEYDVMLQGPRQQNTGTKKKPVLLEIPAIIYLDTKGGRFRQR